MTIAIWITVLLIVLPFDLLLAGRGTQRRQLSRGAALVSQWVNWRFLRGHHDQTVSARCYQESVIRGNGNWSLARRLIDRLFERLPIVGHLDHCRLSYYRDIKFCEELEGRFLA